MGRFKLVAVGEHAKKLTMCDGGPDLLLWQDSGRPIQLGRAVREGDGYKYPNQWNSLSSRHCNLQYQAAEDGEVKKLSLLLSSITNSSSIGTSCKHLSWRC